MYIPWQEISNTSNLVQPRAEYCSPCRSQLILVCLSSIDFVSRGTSNSYGKVIPTFIEFLLWANHCNISYKCILYISENEKLCSSFGTLPLSILNCLSHRSIAVIKHHDQGNLQRMGFFGLWFQGYKVHGRGAWKLKQKAKAHILSHRHGGEAELGVIHGFETPPAGTHDICPARPHLDLAKQCQPLGTKHSNTGVYRGHSRSNHSILFLFRFHFPSHSQ